jgi:hypothetical protein
MPQTPSTDAPASPRSSWCRKHWHSQQSPWQRPKKTHHTQNGAYRTFTRSKRCFISSVGNRALRLPSACAQKESRRERLRRLQCSDLAFLEVSRPVDHERNQPIAGLHNHDLVANNDEDITPQLRHAIEHEWGELVQLNILGDLGAEREP